LFEWCQGKSWGEGFQVTRRRWLLIGLVAVEVAALGLAAGIVWFWFQSPTFRYRVLGDAASMRAVLGTLRRGDSMEKVQQALGDRHRDRKSEYSVRQGLRQLVETYPEIFLQGYDDTDVVLVYSTPTTRYGLQFRYGRLVGVCSQRGPKIRPAEKLTQQQ
jgi:hypothetical protein